MAYAIIINLDHENFPEKICNTLWNAIKARMIANGFHRDGRRFLINEEKEPACNKARMVVESLEDLLEHRHQHIFDYLKDFYGYDTDCVTNFLLPPTDGVEVSEASRVTRKPGS